MTEGAAKAIIDGFQRMNPRRPRFGVSSRPAALCLAVILYAPSLILVNKGNIAMAQSVPTTATQGENEKERRIGDAVHGALSRAVVAPSLWLDSFFGEASADAEHNKTRLRLRLGGFLEEGRGAGLTAKVGIRLSLPIPAIVSTC